MSKNRITPGSYCITASIFCVIFGLVLSVRGQDNPSSPQPSSSSDRDEVVKMEAFQADTTALGRYAESTSSMATKVPVEMKDVAGSLQIFNANAIGDRKALTLEDVYPYVIGMTKVSSQGVGFTLRGFDMNATTTQNVQIDGLQGSTSSKSALGTANVERLEILKGPNSVLYGVMKPGGLVNIITKSPKPKQEITLLTSIASYAGRYSSLGDDLSYVARVDATGPIGQSKHWYYRLVAAGQNQRSFRQGVYDKDFYIYPALTYRWNRETSLTVRMEDIQEKRRSDDGLSILNADASLLPAYNTVYSEPNDVDRDYGEAISAAFRTQIGRWTARASTRTVWHVDTHNALETNGISGTTAVPLSAATVKRNYRNQKNGHRYNFYDANMYGTFDTGKIQNTLIFGAGGGKEYIHTIRIAMGPTVPGISYYYPVVGGSVYPPDGTKANSAQIFTTMFGAYASDQIKIGQRLHLSVGGRYDINDSNTYDLVNPASNPPATKVVRAIVGQGGLLYDFTDDLSAYASWSQSIFPNAINAADAAGNMGFDPEHGEQYEEGLKFETTDHKLRVTLAAYQITKTNVLINTGIANPVTGLNINRFDGSQTSKGTEIEAEWLPVPYWQVQLGWANMHAYISQSSNANALNKALANAPRNSGSLWTRYNVPNGVLKGFGVGMGLIYVSDRFGGDPTGIYFPVSGYKRVDTAFYYKWRNYDIALNVQNILDFKFIEGARNTSNLFPGAPRKMTLSVNSRF